MAKKLSIIRFKPKPEHYEAFLKKYPDNPKNSDEARRVIAKMKPQESKLGEFPEMHSEIFPEPLEGTTKQKVIVPETMVSVPSLPPVRKESIEIVAEVPRSEEDVSETVQEPEPEMEEASPVTSMPKQIPIEKIPVDPDLEMKREKSAALKEPEPTRRVLIKTKNAPLQVRSEPNAQSKILAQIRKGSVVPVFKEAKDWFEIEYQKGKKGWISKKFSQLVN